ncbi:hypothetical protein ASG65_17770 [Bacillus sp. Leaf13]|nr:hypothetical protein ASG65_17770 [Bacillus sp. Leaf13]
MKSETRIDKQSSNPKGIGLQSWFQSNKWGYVASVALLPYAIFKTLWALGVPIGATQKAIEDMHANMEAYSGPVFSLYRYGIDITALFSIIAIFLISVSSTMGATFSEVDTNLWRAKVSSLAFTISRLGGRYAIYNFRRCFCY